jgi:hypothetical protein
MAYTPQFPLLGATGTNFFFVPDTTQRQALGSIISAVDPYWGGAEFIYLKANGTINQGNLVQWDAAPGGPLASALVNAANTGRPTAVAMAAMTAGQFGWFQLSGYAAVSVTASVAAGTTFGITGAGTAGANTAGKQILNAVSAVASTGTVVKNNVVLVNNSITGNAQNTDGWFVGVALSGTNIPGGTTLASLDPNGRGFTMSAAATGTGSVSVTGTYTGFIVAAINRPFCQGAIT